MSTLWRDRRKMGTYLIIGASGFIGSHIYNYCKRNHVEVVGTFCHHCEDSSMIKFDLRSEIGRAHV